MMNTQTIGKAVSDMATSIGSVWEKPLKRSEKHRLRKLLKKWRKRDG